MKSIFSAFAALLVAMTLLPSVASAGEQSVDSDALRKAIRYMRGECAEGAKEGRELLKSNEEGREALRDAKLEVDGARDDVGQLRAKSDLLNFGRRMVETLVPGSAAVIGTALTAFGLKKWGDHRRGKKGKA